MKILIHRISGSGDAVEFALDGVQLRQLLADRPDLLDFSAAVARLRCERVDQVVTVRGDVSFDLRFSCARCGDEVEAAVTIPVRRVLTPRPEIGIVDEDEGTGYHDGREIDAAVIVLEEIALAIPGVLLCRPDCPGVVS